MDFASRVAGKRASMGGGRTAEGSRAIDARGEAFREAVAEALGHISGNADFAAAFGCLGLKASVRKAGTEGSFWGPQEHGWTVMFTNANDGSFRDFVVELSVKAADGAARCVFMTPPRVHGFAFSFARLEADAETPEQAVEMVSDSIAQCLAELRPEAEPAKAPGR